MDCTKNKWSIVSQRSIIFFLIMVLGFTFSCNQSTETTTESSDDLEMEEDDWDKVENGIHLRTGMVYDENFALIQANCLNCHSSKLITQNRATRDGWMQMIRWMQETQGLWQLGDNEPKILDYLAKHYAPKETGRRANIDMAAVEWYILDLENKK